VLFIHANGEYVVMLITARHLEAWISTARLFSAEVVTTRDSYPEARMWAYHVGGLVGGQ
jgi:hypothetical protein